MSQTGADGGAERHARIKRWFFEALDLPHERIAALLDAIPDPDERAEVAALLQAHAQPEALQPPSVHIVNELPTRIGPYQPLALLGEGGMGEVYRAVRIDGGFSQEVALKRMRAGFTHEEAKQRFERERQILARLSHPHIARLLDGGVADGHPWFAMELIEGDSLIQWCNARRLPLAQRVDLLLAVMSAVSYAHRHLVVHRDIKPGNILVDARGHAYLLDFGIAKLLDDEALPNGTASQAMLMTPEYASPEQIEGERISTATDVHALGIVLFELLCGRLPYAPQTGGRGSLLGAIVSGTRERLRQALSRPSGSGTRAASAVDIAFARASSLRELRRALGGDIESIVQRALARQPGDRYASVEAMAADLRAWREGRPLLSTPTPWTRRLGKLVQRHRLASAGVLLLALLLMTGVAAVVWQRERAERAAATAQAVRAMMSSLFAAAAPDANGGATPSLQELLERGIETARNELAAEPEVQRAVYSDIGRALLDLGEYQRAAEVLQVAADSLTPEASGEESALLLLRLAEALTSNSEYRAAEVALERAEQAVRFVPRGHALQFEWLDAAATLALARDDAETAESLSARYVTETNASGSGKSRSDALLFRARVLVKLARFDEALAAFIAARTQLEATSGSLLALAQIDVEHAAGLMAAGRPQDAEPLIRRVLAVQQEVLGADHPNTLSTLNELGNCLSALTRHDEAAQAFEQSISGRERRFGPDHPMVAVAVNNLAIVAYQLRRFEEAAPAFERAATIWSRALGPEHDHTLSARSNLAGTLAELGQAEAALTTLDEVIARRSARGERNVLLGLYITRGLAAEQLQRQSEAGADFARALAIGQEFWPDQPSYWNYARALLGRAYWRQGEPDRAEPMLRESIDEFAKIARCGLRGAMTRRTLAELLLARGDIEEARALVIVARDCYVELLGADHPMSREASALAIRAGAPP